MWDSLKEQIMEVGSCKLTGADASEYIKDGAVVFVYENHKLLIPVSDESPITIHHIGKGTVRFTYKFIEILAKIEKQ